MELLTGIQISILSGIYGDTAKLITAFVYRNLLFKSKLLCHSVSPTIILQKNSIYALIDDSDNICGKINALCVKILQVFVREKNIQYVKFFEKVPVKKIIQYVKIFLKEYVKMPDCP